MGAPRMTRADAWKRRPVVERYHTYCDELRLRLPSYELPIVLTLRFYIPMPKSWSNKKRFERLGSYCDQKPDIDNLVKGFMDAFKVEDKHVAELYAQKLWAEEGAIEILAPEL